MKSTKRRRRKSDATAGKGKVRISTTIPIDTDDQLCQLATAHGLTRSGLASKCIVESVALRAAAQETKVIEYAQHKPANPIQRAAEPSANESG